MKQNEACLQIINYLLCPVLVNPVASKTENKILSLQKLKKMWYLSVVSELCRIENLKPKRQTL